MLSQVLLRLVLKNVLASIGFAEAALAGVEMLGSTGEDAAVGLSLARVLVHLPLVDLVHLARLLRHLPSEQTNLLAAYY